MIVPTTCQSSYILKCICTMCKHHINVIYKNILYLSINIAYKNTWEKFFLDQSVLLLAVEQNCTVQYHSMCLPYISYTSIPWWICYKCKFRILPGTPNVEFLRMEKRNLCFSKLSRWFFCTWKFENCYSPITPEFYIGIYLLYIFVWDHKNADILLFHGQMAKTTL